MIRRLTVLLLAVLTVAAGYLAQGMQPPPAAYDMPRGLGIYFTNADAVVQQMRAALVQHAASIDIAYRGHRDNMANLSAVARELMNAAYAETDVPYEGDYLAYQSGGYEMTYSYTRDGDAYDYTLHIVPQYYTTLAQEEAVTEKVQAVLAELHLDRCRTEEETVRTVCDYVTQHVAYDYVHRNNAHYHLKSTAYGALIYGRACCQGYAVLLYRLLREAGISCRVVTGRAELSDGSTEDHAWNTVTFGGQVYNIDATWESGSGTGEFILRTDEDFPRHTRYDEIGKDGLT